MFKPQAEINGYARPFRVAYLIEEGDDVHGILDAAFSESFGRHGGRQTLIVPVLKGTISAAYETWLSIYDPDFIFAIAQDNEAIAKQIVKFCSPLMIHPVKRNPDPDDHHRWRFRLNDTALTALSWLPFLKVVSGGNRFSPEMLLDCYPRWKRQGIVTDNFGALHDSFDSFPLTRTLKDLVKPLMLTPADAPVDRWRFGIEAEEITDEYELLTALGKTGRITTLAHLSNLRSKNVAIHSHEWVRTFCLVIGDTFTDRVSCWNAGLLFEDALHQSYKTLRLPADLLNDPAKIEHVKAFMNGNNWINTYGGSQPRVTIRSSSLNNEQLAEFAKAINGKNSWCFYECSVISSIEDCCPPKDKERLLSLANKDNIQIPLRHKTEQVPVPQPFQLKHAPFANPICSDGKWVSEYRLSRTNDNGRFSNIRDSWILPARNQLTRLFVENIEARITSKGWLAIPTDSKTGYVEISEPSDERFFDQLLHEVDFYPFPDIRHNGEGRSAVPYETSRTSDKGRYLKGALGLFGSLDSAYEVLTNSFWKKQFEKLGGPSEDQHPQLIQTLKKRLGAQGDTFTFDRPGQWEIVAEAMVKQAAKIRQPKRTTSLDALINARREDINQLVTLGNIRPEDQEHKLEQLNEEVKSSLSYLCGQNVFHQGYNWLCGHCAYRNWTALDSFRRELACQVCHEEHLTPVDLKLDFRMNDFLAECIREHDTFSVIWTLGKLLHKSRDSSFIFAPQTELFRKWPESRNGHPDRELDLLCVIGGKVIIGEVKNSLLAIDNNELNNLIEAAADLRPDIVVIAALKGEQRLLDQKIEFVKSKISERIEVRGLLKSADEHRQISFYLPS